MRDVAFAPWARLVSIGTEHAMSGLSQVIGQEIDVEGFPLTQIPVASVSHLAGGRELISVRFHVGAGRLQTTTEDGGICREWQRGESRHRTASGARQ